MTEQNRPADETGHGTDRTGDAGTSWAPPHAQQPHPAAPTQPQPQPAANPYAPPQQPTPQFPPHAAGTAHQGWPPAGWGQQAGAPHQAAGHPGFSSAFQPPAPVAAPARRAGRWRLGVAGLVAGALIGGGTGAGVATLAGHDGGTGSSAVSAQSVVIKDPQSATSATAAAAKAAPSVVTIYVSSSSSAGSGSGVVLTADGYVLTNNHVVTLDSSTQDATVQVRTADGTLYDGSVVGTDPTSDLAVVKLSDASGLTPAAFADSTKVQVGDLAIAIGAPLGLSNTVTDGIISATNRAVATGSDTDQTVIDALQTDAAINPGNSGGALVDAAGQVIGINSAIATVASSDVPGQNSGQSGNIGVGFAIPSNTAKRIADEIIAKGSATHALLGVSARTATQGASSEVGTGAEVVQVQGGSAAADAGLRVGDVVTALGDRAVTTSTELTAAVRSAQPGDRVTLTVRRGSDSSTVDVTLDAAAN
ncbi:MAG TPA: trypsin-like peptidase domain-containing protein [Modestobacter sp.]|nr:trypsin-like peptidase domain-containing protein [Modestobacter sp.]